MNKIIFLLISVFLLTGCKGTKTASGAVLKKMKTERIIANHYNSIFNFNTLNAKIKVDYKGEDASFSPSVSLRMQKDQKIWLSAKVLGITMAKILITPDKVSYYEKLNGTYFEGDFVVLSRWLGTELNFDKVQQLLIGQALYNLRDQKYATAIFKEHYQLTSKNDVDFIQKIVSIDPGIFKIRKQKITQQPENRSLEVEYPRYQKIGNQYFPETLYIRASDSDSKTSIKIEYRTVDYNAKVSFPFSIPGGYEKVTIE